MIAAAAHPSGRIQATAAMASPANRLRAAQRATASAIVPTIASFSMPEIDTALKYGQTAKKEAKHHAGRLPYARRSMAVTATSATSSSANVLRRAHSSGLGPNLSPSAIQIVQSGEEKPNTGCPGLKTSPNPFAKFRA